MFITGPDVIKTVTHEDVSKQDLGGAMTHNATQRRGPFHRHDDAECLAMIRELLSFLPSTIWMMLRAARLPIPSTARTPRSIPMVPADAAAVRHQGRDPRCRRRQLFFEVQEHYAKNIVVGFARLGGRPSASSPISLPSWRACWTSTPRQGRALRALL